MNRKNMESAHAKAPISFNHALIYVADLTRSLHFYGDLLGFDSLEIYEPDYARLRSAPNNSTIALHMRAGDISRSDGDIILFFEVKHIDATCARLKAAGVEFTQEPRMMPWGWKHAYLLDPDGHEVSLYWAGAKRLRADEGPEP